MPRPLIRVNNFLRNNLENEAYIDNISKLFILCELPLGINRLSLLRNVNTILVVASVVYSLGLLCYLINSLKYLVITRLLNTITVVLSVIQIIFYVFLNWIMSKRLWVYYNELNNFDNQVGYRPKIGYGTIKNIVQAVVTILYIVTIICLPFVRPGARSYPQLIPAIMGHVLELHYVGHLISLLVPRLYLINYYMRMSICSNRNEVYLWDNGKYTLCKMEKLINLYHTLIKAYGFLIEAIKWQLLFTLIATFIYILCACYYVAHIMIRGDGDVMTMLSFLAKSMVIMLPLFAPCLLGDQVRGQVKRLRELLTARLYENQLDNCSRSMARALLAWTESRDMSFSLLRMIDIDMSLPFKFVGLLVTYLIILLQFEKVINP